ncbi:MAG: hypothetical protein LBC02_07340 [Planctomycetaceae bacterium]|jgi:hypothetical protein|nr:hypothetical protein [Planctomycetaceae bacterium]
MVRGTTTQPSQRQHRTLILPIEQEEHHVILTIRRNIANDLWKMIGNTRTVSCGDGNDGYRLNGKELIKKPKTNSSKTRTCCLPDTVFFQTFVVTIL